MLHRGDVRTDGFGRWPAAGRLLAFYLEYDTGTETVATVATSSTTTMAALITTGREAGHGNQNEQLAA